MTPETEETIELKEHSYSARASTLASSFFANSRALNTGSTWVMAAATSSMQDSGSLETIAVVTGVFNLVCNYSNYRRGNHDNHTYTGMIRGAAELAIGLSLLGINGYIISNNAKADVFPLLFYSKSSLEMIYKGMEKIMASGYAAMSTAELALRH